MFKRVVVSFVRINVNGLLVLEVSDPSVCVCEASRAVYGRCSLQFSEQTVHHKEKVDLKNCKAEHLELESNETFEEISKSWRMSEISTPINILRT
jgi:hypothetical protein